MSAFRPPPGLLAYLVCDRCGLLAEAQPPVAIFHCACGAEAAWEFKRLDHALAYQAQVKARLRVPEGPS